jgi:hypothetical protein
MASIKGFEIVDAMDDLGRGRMVGLQLAAPDVVDDADGLQGVLVDRIGVVHVELGLADDRPIRAEPPSRPSRSSGSEPGTDVGRARMSRKARVASGSRRRTGVHQ